MPNDTTSGSCVFHRTCYVRGVPIITPLTSNKFKRTNFSNSNEVIKSKGNSSFTIVFCYYAVQCGITQKLTPIKQIYIGAKWKILIKKVLYITILSNFCTIEKESGSWFYIFNVFLVKLEPSQIYLIFWDLNYSGFITFIEEYREDKQCQQQLLYLVDSLIIFPNLGLYMESGDMGYKCVCVWFSDPRWGPY